MKHVAIISLLAILPLFANATDSKYSQRAERSAEILHSAMESIDSSIPLSLLDNATCVSTLRLYKVVIGIGIKSGVGVTSCRTANGWSAPSYTRVSGVSVGWQFGVNYTDMIFVFVDKNAPKDFDKASFTLGVDAAVTAGPVGRGAVAGVDFTLESPVFSYSSSKGLFIGIALDGAVLQTDKKANRKVYESRLKSSEIFKMPSYKAPVDVTSYSDALLEYSK